MTVRLTWHVCVCVWCVCVCASVRVCVCRVQWKAPQDSPYVQEVLCVCVRACACVCARSQIFFCSISICACISVETHMKSVQKVHRLYCYGSIVKTLVP